MRHEDFCQRLGERFVILGRMGQINAGNIGCGLSAHGFNRSGIDAEALFEFAGESGRAARAEDQLGWAASANKNIGMLAGFRIDDGRGGGVSALLKLIHAGFDRLVFEVLEKLVQTDAASAAAKFEHCTRPVMWNQPR